MTIVKTLTYLNIREFKTNFFSDFEGLKKVYKYIFHQIIEQNGKIKVIVKEGEDANSNS